MLRMQHYSTFEDIFLVTVMLESCLSSQEEFITMSVHDTVDSMEDPDFLGYRSE